MRISDWSSDVCSSDLTSAFGGGRRGPPTTVGVASATAADLPVTIEALGTVTPTAVVTVRPQVSGVIESIAFKEGQLVKQGELLAQIDPRPFRNALQQAQGALKRDEGQMVHSRLQRERYKQLLAQSRSEEGWVGH